MSRSKPTIRSRWQRYAVLIVGLLGSAIARDVWGQKSRAAEREPYAARLKAIGTSTSAWQVLWADLDGDRQSEIVYASYSGILTCQDLRSGRIKWTYDLQGLPYAIRSCDLDADKKQEVLVTSSSLQLHVLSADGKLRWNYDGQAPLYGLAAGRLLDQRQMLVAVGGEDVKITLLDARGRVVKRLDYIEPEGNRHRIRALDAGDTNADGLDELLVVNGYNRFTLVDPRSGKFLWDQADRRGRWRYLFDGKLLDLEGKGRATAFVGSQDTLLAVSADGTLLWQESVAKDFDAVGQVNIAPVDLDADGRPEIAAQLGPELAVFNRAGEVRYRGSAAYFCFNGLAAPSKPANQLLMASVTGADRNVYAITLSRGGDDGLDAFTGPPGHCAKIHRSLEEIRNQVLKRSADRLTPRRTYEVPVAGGSPTLDRVAAARQNATLHESYPYDNITFFTQLVYQEEGYGKTGQGAFKATQELLELAEAAERNGHYHGLAVAHGAFAGISPATVDQWLRRTPKTCLGILFSEMQVDFYHLPENAQLRATFDKFADEEMVPLIDIAVKHRKPVHLMMKQGYWVITPAMKSMYTRLFTPERRKWLIPSVEESAATAPELNLMGWMGLWRSGLVDRWASNIINDQMVLNGHYAEWMPCDAHHVLRHAVASAAAGATHYKFRLDGLRDRLGRFGASGPARRELTPVGRLSWDLFLHLLGKGLLDPPTPETICGLSPIAFRCEEPAVAFVAAGRASKSDPPPEILPESAGGLFSGTEWPFLKTRDSYAPRYLLDIQRYGHGFIPRTLFGLPTIVPSWHNASQCSFIEKGWTTDGVRVEGRSAEAMGPAILTSFQKAAENFPVRATNCFWMGTRRKNGMIRVTMVDTPYVDPVGAEVDLITRAPIRALHDVIFDRPLDHADRSARLRIEPGTFRIVDVRLDGVPP